MIKRQQKGFTIVELLIVIVVIGILAAVTLVTYNGIQARAENLKTINGVTALNKALQIYYSDNGSYPNGASFPCVGTVSTMCGGNPGGLCFGLGYVGGSSTFNNAILTVTTSIPEVSKQKIDCASGSKGEGALYYNTGTPSYLIYYVLKGDVGCGSTGVGTTVKHGFSVQTTLCYVSVTPN